MDPLLAARIEGDPEFEKKVAKFVTDYLDFGQSALDYYSSDFDTAHDILMCYAPLTRQDLENLERGHPKRFMLPMTATQITTMATYIAQVLFGDDSPHKVTGRGPEDDVAAEHMNQLLRWNAEQQPTFLLGYLWIQDVLTYNRGVFYNSWKPIYRIKVEGETVTHASVLDESGAPRPYSRLKKTRVPVGGYVKYEIVSPYDFVCDPALPLWRLQEGRFAGHRTLISWHELHRRSKLPPDHPDYVLPSAVDRLKQNNKNDRKSSGPTTPGATGNATGTAGRDALQSRTAWERTRSLNPLNADTAEKNDHGIVEAHEMWIRAIPVEQEFGEGEDSTVYQALVANRNIVLAINDSPLEHDEFPYSAAEGRPSGYYQFSPSWVLILKSLQDYVDYFKNRRQQAIGRTLGNIFIARPDKCNLTDFLNPDKEGLIIPVTDGMTDRLDDVIKQVPINDVTQGFQKEMMDLVSFSETVTGANSNMQGQVDGDGTATEFAGTQQMSAGRMSSVARMISVQGLVPQTRQITSNFQQFLSVPMSIRFVPNGLTTPINLFSKRALDITPDVIQGKFDFVAHDGALPGTDGRKVAAMTKLLEVAVGFPQFFTPEPGNIDARAIILATAKAAGVNVENFQFRADASQAAPQPGLLPDLPAPGPGPGRPAESSATELPQVGPPQIRPQQI
jgi:hypothetical protein